MSSAQVLQQPPVLNDHQVLTLLDTSSSQSINNTIDDTATTANNMDKDDDTPIMTEEEEEEQKRKIQSYLNKPESPNLSFIASKRVPRLGPFLLLKTLGVGEFGKVKMGRHFETGQIVSSSSIYIFSLLSNKKLLGGCQIGEKRKY